GGEPPDPARLADHLAAGLQGRGPDLAGVVLDPAGPGEMLGQLDLADRHGAQRPLRGAFEGDGPGRGGALVDGENEGLHRGRLERRSPDSTSHRGEAAALEPGVPGAGRFITTNLPTLKAGFAGRKSRAMGHPCTSPPSPAFRTPPARSPATPSAPR